MRVTATRVAWAAALAVAWAAGPARAGGLDAALAEAQEHLRAWDMAGAEAAVARAQALDPGNPGTLFVAGWLDHMEGRYDDAAERLGQAVAGGADGLAAHMLEIARATAEATRGYEEHLTRDGHFLIRHAPGLDAAMVPYVEDVLEGAWRGLVPLFDHAPRTPVRVEIYPRVEVLGQVSSLTVEEIKTSGTIALCKYNRLMFTSPRDLVYGYAWADTVAHELIHLLITQKSRNQVPIWLHEGLAKYYESRWKDDAAPVLDRRSEDLLARALAGDTLISFEAMSPSMAKLPSQEATATAFAEVFTVIQFLSARAGDTVARELVAAMGAGRSDQEAVSAVARLPWARFEPAWRQHLRAQGLRTMDDLFDMRLLFKGSDTEADELSALKGEKARRYVWLGDKLALKKRHLAATKEYRKAEAEVGDGTPIVQSKLARALLALGRVDEAIAALTPALSLYPEYVLLRVYLGEAHLRRGDLAEARTHLEAAVLVNPFDPDVHAHLAKVYGALGETELARREERVQQILAAP